MKKDLRIYVHIPFCESKCCYCDFASFVERKDVQKRYFDKLICDIENFNIDDRVVKSVYFGGGTPSVVDESFVEKILQTLHKKFIFDEKAEISIECNPSSSMIEKLKKYRSYGINRISFGVQSLDDSTLKFLNRRHNASIALKAIKDAVIVGFDNISADLMIGVNKDGERLILDADKLIRCGVKHISAYMLQIEENTPLYNLVQRGKVNNLPTEDECVKFYENLVNFLQTKGFYQYEISNFALKGYRCNHNLGYWQGDDYIGFGLSAHSYIDGVRFAQSRRMQDYLNNKNITKEDLSTKQKIEEIIMLGLRCEEGVNLEKVKKLGYDLNKNANLSSLIKNEYVFKKDGKIYINPKFYGVSNIIIVKLLPN